MAGGDRKFNLQLLSQCGCTYSCLSSLVPEIHYHVAGMLSKQATNKHGSTLLYAICMDIGGHGITPCFTAPSHTTHFFFFLPALSLGCTILDEIFAYVTVFTSNHRGSHIPSSYRLVGLVVRHPPRERKIPGSNPACAGIFSGSSHTSDSKIGAPVATLPGAWRYRVSAGTGQPCVSIL